MPEEFEKAVEFERTVELWRVVEFESAEEFVTTYAACAPLLNIPGNATQLASCHSKRMFQKTELVRTFDMMVWWIEVRAAVARFAGPERNSSRIDCDDIRDCDSWKAET